MVAAQPLEEPSTGPPRRVEPAVSVEPASLQSISAQGKPDAPMGLQLPRGHDELSAALDESTALAAAAAVREACPNFTHAPRWHRQLLPHQGSYGCGGSREREHPHAHQPRPRLSEPALSAAQGPASGGQQPRTDRRPQNLEDRLIRAICQILAQLVQNIRNPASSRPRRARSAIRSRTIRLFDRTALLRNFAHIVSVSVLMDPS